MRLRLALPALLLSLALAPPSPAQLMGQGQGDALPPELGSGAGPLRAPQLPLDPDLLARVAEGFPGLLLGTQDLPLDTRLREDVFDGFRVTDARGYDPGTGTRGLLQLVADTYGDMYRLSIAQAARRDGGQVRIRFVYGSPWASEMAGELRRRALAMAELLRQRELSRDGVAGVEGLVLEHLVRATQVVDASDATLGSPAPGGPRRVPLGPIWAGLASD